MKSNQTNLDRVETFGEALNSAYKSMQSNENIVYKDQQADLQFADQFLSAAKQNMKKNPFKPSEPPREVLTQRRSSRLSFSSDTPITQRIEKPGKLNETCEKFLKIILYIIKASKSTETTMNAYQTWFDFIVNDKILMRYMNNVTQD